MEQNPYAAPQVEVLEVPDVPPMPGWSAGYLRVLAWLSLASVLGTLLELALNFAPLWQQADGGQRYSDWLGLAVGLLGCYLLLVFKRFAEVRFAARQLTRPVAACLLSYLLLGGVSFWVSDAAMAELGWQTLAYLGLIGLSGAFTLWLGVRLLQVPQVYPVFRLVAWLELVGGICLASIVLIFLSVVPLLGSGVAMALVFFRAAAELPAD